MPEIDEKAPLSRRQTEEIAVFAVYDILTYAHMGLSADVESILSGLSGVPYSECDPFAKRMVIAFLKEREAIFALYQARMPKWRFERLNRLEQALLYVAYCHYHHAGEEVPKAVAVDSAVRFAKKYLDANDYKFVNAVVDKVLSDA